MALLAGRLFALFSSSPARAWAGAAVFAVLFGAVAEMLQGVLSARRHADGWDIVANSVGAVICSILAVGFIQWRRRK